MPSTIIARADALMQRRRQNGGETDEFPVLTDAIEPIDSEPDDDVPVLLDIDPNAQLPEPGPIDQPPSPSGLSVVDMPTFDTGQLDILAHELARRVEQRLVAEMPRIIESTVRDFLAEQEMIATLQPRD